MSFRMAQINELLLQELSVIIKDEFRQAWITVTDVNTAPDLRDARVWVSIFNQKDQQVEPKEIVKKLQNMDYHFRQILLKRLSLKYIPKLHFALDTTAEKASKIEMLIDQEKKKIQPGGN